MMTVTHLFSGVYDNIFPALFPVFQAEFGLTLPELGLLASLPPLFQALIGIPSGYLADRIGAKKTIAFSLVVYILSGVGMVLSSNLLVLIASINAMSLTSIIYHPGSYSYLTKVVSPGNRSKALGLMSAGGPVGVALGPITLTLALSYFGNDSWRLAYLFWIIPLVVVLGATLKLRSEKELRTMETGSQPAKTGAEGSARLGALLTRGLLVFLAFNAFWSMGGKIINVFIPTYLNGVRGLSVADASLVYGASSLLGVVAAPIGGFFADRLGNRRWLLFDYVSSIVFMALTYLSPVTVLFVSFYFGYSFCNYMGMAANTSIVAGLTPTRQRGMGYALFFLPGSIIGSVTPAACGFLAALMGLPILLPIAVAVSSISVLILRLGMKN